MQTLKFIHPAHELKNPAIKYEVGKTYDFEDERAQEILAARTKAGKPVAELVEGVGEAEKAEKVVDEEPKPKKTTRKKAAE